jgi:septal ring factor EnvC (AmiA/AmiB activator)
VGESYRIKEKNKNEKRTMKDFLKFNFKYILLAVFGVLLVYLLIRTFNKDTNNPELMEFKLNQIDNKIKTLNTKLDNYNDSILFYKKEIMKLNTEISKIRIKKTVVNNFYEEKTEEIKILNAKEVDSILRKRYKY